MRFWVYAPSLQRNPHVRCNSTAMWGVIRLIILFMMKAKTQIKAEIIANKKKKYPQIIITKV
jgi:hypothetical protein